MQQTQTDVLVIGAGQAGLACGRALAACGLSFVIHERHARVGDSWRKRYQSLTLFTPRAYSILPGRSLAGDSEGYPTKDELAEYLEQYAAAFALPVVTGDRVSRLEREGA